MQFDGLFTAIVTPFRMDGSLDKDALRRMIEFQIKSGVQGIVPCTVTGENATLSHTEHEWVVELAVKYVNKRIGVLASTGSNSTREAIRLSLHAQKVGADAVFLITPYLNLPSQRGLYLHFKTIAGSLDIPCVIFNLRTQTNVNVHTDTLLKLIDACPNIVGICEVADTLFHIKKIRAQTPSKFKIYTGRDDQAVALFRLGGNGLVSIAANIVPDQMHRIVQSAGKKDFNTADQIAESLFDLFQILSRQPDPVPVKTILARYQLCEERFRLPICASQEIDFKAAVNKVLTNLPAKIDAGAPFNF
jgi:4-hydroxy-tetrahydrodipicolinate synthase